ncbi:LysR family transcriptional regulator [Caviibacter abscessus]|uniref:LysR family transcriptional regulator n=1 Tax=Caviibacter abscessus TaxID=1766719 RepID=UPI00082A46BE|nr:LysR family transcriptional regulator [Caviibacter abscessus]
MDLHQLKSFYETCKAQSFTRASEKLFISQSAISVQIKRLEESLNTKLIERTSKTFKLTFAGKELFKMASEIFDNISRMENNIKKIVDNNQIKIFVGATHNIGEPVLPQIIKDYRDINPKVEFDIFVKNNNSLFTNLKEGNLDIIFTEDMAIGDKEVKVIDTDYYPFVIIAPNSVKKYKDLANIYYLKRDNANINNYIEQFEEIVGFSNDKVMSVNGSIETIKHFVNLGIGYAVVPYYCIYHNVFNKEFKIIHRFDKKENKFQMMYLKETVQNDLIKDFIDFVKKYDIDKPLKEIKNKL